VGVGNAVVSAVFITTVIKDLPEFPQKLAEGIKRAKRTFSSVQDMVRNIVNNRGDIRRMLDTDAGRIYARKYFDNFVRDGNFDDWWQNAKRWDLDNPLNFEVHHIIPVSVLEGNPGLQDLLFKYQGRFDFNGIDNGIPLPKRRLRFDQSGHGNHPDYDRLMGRRVGDIMRRGDWNDAQKFEEIQNLIRNTRQRLELDVLLGNSNVNDIINF
jgi:hypothetical protein